MAIKKKQPPKKEPLTSNFLLPMPEIPKGENLVLDKGTIPIVGLFGRSVELTYAKEFALIANMKVNQSAVFPIKKIYMINAIRTRIQKISSKKFVVKKVNPEFNRIWRVADNAVIHHGGRIPGVSPYVRDDEKSKSKFKHGGKRTPGVYSKGKPRGTHKEGVPIAPVVNEVINNQ